MSNSISTSGTLFGTLSHTAHEITDTVADQFKELTTFQKFVIGLYSSTVVFFIIMAVYFAFTESW